MTEKSIFGLDPEKLDRLLSIGTDGVDGAEPEDKKSQPAGEDASGRESDGPSPAAFLGISVEQPGSRIGPYKLLRVLGEGGMGIVYLAEQAEPIRRQVALKIIKPGMDSARVIARFDAEKQTLALLDHPNIAHVHDAGATETGRPYFVMEHVDGLPVTEHCDRYKLAIEDRLGLFLQICQAVHHAHQKGIIHRDIKPSNILVTSQDDQAVPKIIDFGVAKAIAQPLTERTQLTEQGQLFGTPEYMSPEQANIGNEDIDTRSDIYSLGVLLYVLLTGVLPFDSETLREGGIDHIRRVILETEPEKPSTRLTSLGQEANNAAKNRCTAVAALAKRLHRELEWIPLKAMRKERKERYQSALELADDIENYLSGAALAAGPPTTVYRLKKFVRRNRAFVTGAVAVLVVVLAGMIASTVFAIGQSRARTEAQAVADFLRHNVLESLDQHKVGGKQITVRSVLDAASRGLEGGFTGPELVEAEIRHTLGFAYWSLGVYDRAELHLGRALDVHQAHLGAEHPRTLGWTKNLGWVYQSQSRFDEAERLFARALEGELIVLGEEHGETLHCMSSLAITYYMQGRFDEGNRLSIRALETLRRMFGKDSGPAISITAVLAWGYHWQGRYEEARRLFARWLAISRRRSGEKHLNTLSLMHGLGVTYCDLGRYEEAEQLLLKALDLRREGWGPEHLDTLSVMVALGWLYCGQGRYDLAESMLAEVQEIAKRVLGEDHFIIGNSGHALAIVYLSQERFDEAEPLLNSVLGMGHRLLGEENWATLGVMNTLGKLYTKQGRFDRAKELLLKTLEVRGRVLGQEHPHTFTSMNDLGVLYRKQGRYEKAEPLLRKALEARGRKLGDEHPATLESLHELGLLYKDQAENEAAESLLLEALDGRTKTLRAGHPDTLDLLSHIIELHEAQGKSAEAENRRAQLAVLEVEPLDPGDTSGPSLTERKGSPVTDPVRFIENPEVFALEHGGTWNFQGSFDYDAETDTYTVTGSGKDIWLGADEFHFVHKRLTGGGTIAARIDSIERSHVWAKAGVMMRNSLDSDSEFAAVVITPAKRVCLHYRSAAGLNAVSINTDQNAVTLPHWVRLVREGNVFKAQHCDDGLNWKDLQGTSYSVAAGISEIPPAAAEVSMDETVYAGLAVTSHRDPFVMTTAEMSDVALTGDVNPVGEFISSEDIGFQVIALPRK